MGELHKPPLVERSPHVSLERTSRTPMGLSTTVEHQARDAKVGTNLGILIFNKNNLADWVSQTDFYFKINGMAKVDKITIVVTKMSDKDLS